MNKEMWLVIMPALGWFLFALGGTQISNKIQGQKWTRRFLLPALWGILIFLVHYGWWQAAAVAILACTLFHQGYGSKTSWKMRLVVFAGYGLISVPIGLSAWNIITAAACPLLFFLASKKTLDKTIG